MGKGKGQGQGQGWRSQEGSGEWGLLCVDQIGGTGTDYLRLTLGTRGNRLEFRRS